jgi:hypothetical protein
MAAWRAGLSGSAANSGGRVLTSTDGSLAFTVLRTSTGLLIERQHCPIAGARTAQMMAFDSAEGFDRWCDCEPVRFDDPKLHDQLRREGHEALDSLR